MLTIWFNRAYATTHHVITMVRGNPDRVPVRIVGTHADAGSPVLAACDAWELEPGPGVTGAAYVEWALRFCERHGVDVFVPRLHLDVIAAARGAFAEAGVSVVAGPAGPAALMEDKQAAYEDARSAGVAVPPFEVVTDADALLDAYARLSARVGTVCLKPVTGVGGEGFRILTRDPPQLSDVLAHPSPLAPVEQVADVLRGHVRAGGVVPPLMLLPFLTGPEVSVDTLADASGDVLAALPRRKEGRRQVLVEDHEAIAVARSVVTRHGLSFLTNTQVRYWQDPQMDAAPRAYLLETNTRMSGGVHHTALTGLNLPWAAVQLALGNAPTLPSPVFGASYTTVPQTIPVASGADTHRGVCV